MPVGGGDNPPTDSVRPLEPATRFTAPSEMMQRYLRQEPWEEPCGILIVYAVAGSTKPIPRTRSRHIPDVGKVESAQRPSGGRWWEEVLNSLNS